MKRSITSQICFRTKLTAMVALLAFCSLVMLPVSAPAQTSSTAATALVTGATANGAIFNGILKITSFAVNTATGAITATGTLTGTLTQAGNTLATVSQTVTTVITSATASCTILSLTLGPIHLNLLGLHIDTNTIVLNITAVPGQNALLGNLLCDIAGLLNGGSLSAVLQNLVTDLNNLLAAL